MSFFGGKQKTTQTMTPINPPWVTDSSKWFADRFTGLAGQEPRDFVAPANSLLTRAGEGAAALSPNPDHIGAADATLRQLMGAGANTYDPATIKASSLLTKLGSYMNPFEQQVIDASLADHDFNAGRSLAQTRLGLATDDAMGGSGGALELAATRAGLGRNRDLLSSGLRSEGFQFGANLSNLDADRGQQASVFNANAINRAREFNAGANDLALSRQQGAAESLLDRVTNRIGTQAQVGGMLQAIDQAEAGAPIDVATQLGSAFSGLPLDLFQGQQIKGVTKGGGGLLSKVGDAAKIASAVATFSDYRLKEDIQTIGYDERGRRWVSYRYLWDEPDTRHEGVIAQEVAATDPHAVSRHESGYLMVNYGELV